MTHQGRQQHGSLGGAPCHSRGARCDGALYVVWEKGRIGAVTRRGTWDVPEGTWVPMYSGAAPWVLKRESRQSISLSLLLFWSRKVHGPVSRVEAFSCWSWAGRRGRSGRNLGGTGGRWARGGRVLGHVT